MATMDRFDNYGPGSPELAHLIGRMDAICAELQERGKPCKWFANTDRGIAKVLVAVIAGPLHAHGHEHLLTFGDVNLLPAEVLADRIEAKIEIG